MVRILSLFIYIIFLFLITNCSFKNPGGFFDNRLEELEKEITLKNTKLVFSKSKKFRKEISGEVKINISKPIINENWTQKNLNINNEIPHLSYESKRQLIYKSRKIGKNKHDFKSFSFEPIILNDNVIFYDTLGNIYNFSLNKNKILWRFNFYKKRYKNLPINIKLKYSNNNLIASDNLGYIYSLSISSGALNWAKNYGIPFRSNLKIHNGYIFVLNQDNKYYFIKESNGDLDKAIEILRIKGVSKASKKMSREAREGVVAISGDEKKTSIIEVNCETDFVAKNDDFISFVKELSELNNSKNSNLEELKKSKMKNGSTVDSNLVALIAKIGEKITIGQTKTISNSSSVNYQYLHTVVKDNLAKLAVVVSLETKENSEIIKTFGKQLSMHIAASNPLALESDLIDKTIIDKEQELISEELKNSGKSDEIVKKISLGKINKFKEENALLSQAWVMEPKKKVKDILKELSINDLKIKEFSRIKIGE